MARPQSTDPDERLSFYLDALQRAREHGGHCRIEQGDTMVDVDAHKIEGEIRRLALEFQNHVPTLFANALLCDQESDDEGAQRYLDRVLAIQPSHADAVVMRSQLAMQEGDLALTREMLVRALAAAPDQSKLHETLAALEYVSGHADEARVELGKAERLGAPAWRIAFHRGLIEEAAGSRDLALVQYAAVIQERPEFEPAQAHARALQAEAQTPSR
jgi:tetratricopeptide (TPR) repeat protein